MHGHLPDKSEKPAAIAARRSNRLHSRTTQKSCQLRLLLAGYRESVGHYWFRDKDYGFLDNGGGLDIMVRKADLVNCQYLKVGATVEFECHTDKKGLMAKNVKLSHQNKSSNRHHENRGAKPFRPGVMT
jgi:CspA family cold shock protein